MNPKQRLAALEARANPPRQVIEVWRGNVGFPDGCTESNLFTHAPTGRTLTAAELDAMQDAPGTKVDRLKIIFRRDWRSPT